MSFHTLALGIMLKERRFFPMEQGEGSLKLLVYSLQIDAYFLSTADMWSSSKM